MTKRKTLWIDMDDTICDFMTPFKNHVKAQLAHLYNRHNFFKKSILSLWDCEKKEFLITKSLINKIENFLSNKIKLDLTNEEKDFFIYPQSEIGFLLNLEPIKGAKEKIEKLKEHFDIKILTKSSYMNIESYKEKRLWIEKYYGIEMCQHLYFVPDKSYILGDILVDDNIWENFTGIQLQYGTENIENWEKVYEKLITMYE